MKVPVEAKLPLAATVASAKIARGEQKSTISWTSFCASLKETGTKTAPSLAHAM